MSIKLYPDTGFNGIEYSFDPSDNVYVYKSEGKISTTTKLPPSNDDFPVQSIKNDTDYILLIEGVNVFDVFIGSINDT